MMIWLSGLAFSSLAIMCLALAWRVRGLSRRLDELREAMQRQDARLASLQADLGALCRASLGAGERIVQLANQVRWLDERQERTELQTMSERSFDRAIKLVQEGGDIDALMQQCGLTRGEAELLVTVHGMDAA